MAEEVPVVRARVAPSPSFRGEEDEEGSLWLWQLERNMRLGACTQEQRLDFAIMHLEGMALRWARSQNFLVWETFLAGFRNRFCQEDRDAVLHRLQNLRQGEGQSARRLADEVLTLCGQLPHMDAQTRKNYFVRALKVPTRQLVTARLPESLEMAEQVATALERMESQSNIMDVPQPSNVPATTAPRPDQHSAVDDLLGEFQKMRLEFVQLKEATNKQTYRPRLPIRCHACGEEGHVVRDCPRNQPPPAGGNNRAPVPNRQGQPGNRGLNLAHYHDEPEQEIQADLNPEGEDTRSDVQRFLEEQYGQPPGDPQLVTRGVRDDGDRGQARKRPHINPGWDVGEVGPQVPELPPRLVPRGPPRVRASGLQPTGGLYHVVDQLKATKANASMWTYLQDSARARGELLNALQGQPEAVPPVSTPAAVPAMGPEPMMHYTGAKAEGRAALLYSVVTCEVAIGSVSFEAVVDSGASNTTLSHVVARKLGLLDFMEETSLVFTTSSGETDRPWGILRGVPLTVGKLTLPLDMCVTGARGYEMLLGNDWLFSAQATLHIGSKELSFRLSRDLVDTVALRCGPIKRSSLSKSSKGKQCLLVPAVEEDLEEDRILLEADEADESSEVEEIGESYPVAESSQDTSGPIYDSPPEESLSESSFSESEPEQEQPDEDEDEDEDVEDSASEESMDTVDVEIAKCMQHRAITDAPIPEPTMQSVQYGADLIPTQVQSLKLLIEEKRLAFAWDKLDMGRCDFVEHHIEVHGHAPIQKRPFRYSASEKEILQKEINMMLELGVIEHSQSPWGFPAILLPKKDGGIRVCIDYRDLNTITKTDAYPLPRIDEMLDRLHGAQYFSKLDCKSAYWMIRMAEDSKEMTAVITPFGKYSFCYMPFGLKNAPSTFQRAIDSVLAPLEYAYPYLDDIIVFSSTWEDHVGALLQVFDRLIGVNMKLKLSKCEFGMSSITYLGHLATREGIAQDPAKTKAIEEWPLPTNVTQLRSFLGLASYYRRFVKNFSRIAFPLHALLHKAAPYQWTQLCQHAFEELQRRLVTSPILIYPDFTQPFLLQTDWSKDAVGAILSQVGVDKLERVVAYASRTCQPAERAYAPVHGECLAVVWAVKLFRPYLYGRPFRVQTDHNALKWLMTTKDLTGRLARWSLKLQEYDFTIDYRQGVLHSNVDALSRRVCSYYAWEGLPTPAAGCIPLPAYMLEASVEQPKCATCGLTSSPRGLLTCTRCDSTHHTFCADPKEDPLLSISWLCGSCIARTRLALLEGGEGSPGGVGEVETITQQQQPVEEPEEEPFDFGSLPGPVQPIEPWRSIGEPISDLLEDELVDALETEQDLDITEDEHVQIFLHSGDMEPKWPAKEKKRVRARASRFFLEAATLYRKPTGRFPARFVPPCADRRNMVSELHALGHFGIARTMGIVQQQYYWLGITKDVKDIVASCPECTAKRVQWAKTTELRPVPVEGPWHRVVMDLVGPLPRTARGNTFIVSAIDHFTKWAEAAPLQDRYSAQVGEFILRDLIARHGRVHTLHSDGGSEFLGRCSELLGHFNIRTSHSEPEHPQSAGLVERFQKTLIASLHKCAAYHPEDWDLYIPITLLGYRSSIQSSTKFTPFFLEYGREADLAYHGHRAFQESTLTDELTAEAIATHVAARTVEIGRTLPLVTANVQRAQVRQKRDYDRRRGKDIAKSAHRSLRPGDWIRLRPPEKHTRKMSKHDMADRMVLYKVEYVTQTYVRCRNRNGETWNENPNRVQLYRPGNMDSSDEEPEGTGPSHFSPE